MFYKNAVIYQFTQPSAEIIPLLEEAMAQKPFTHCGKRDHGSIGFYMPLGDKAQMLTHETADAVTFCLKSEERILPSSVVNDAVAEKVAAIEEDEDRKVYRKEKQSIKEEIVFDLRPQAFIKTGFTYAYIDKARNILVVNSSTAKQAETLCSLLREALGSLPVVPVRIKARSSVHFTDWLRKGAPEGFELGDSCKLVELREGGATNTCKNENLQSEEILALLDAGKIAESIGLSYDDQVHFKISEHLHLKGLKFGDDLINEARDGIEDETALFDTQTFLNHRTIGQLFDALGEAFDGWVIQDPLDFAPQEASEQPEVNTSPESNQDDDLYQAAVDYVVESGRASISSVQRQLRIGYNRAARLIEAMEKQGIVSEMGLNGAREVIRNDSAAA